MNKIFGLILSFIFISNSWSQADSLLVPTRKDTVLSNLEYAYSSKDSTNKTDSLVLTGKVVKGIASYYSANLDGTKTATGEVFRNNKFTGASNNLKLNTWVKVTNLKNGKTVIVRINDRMHPNMKKKGRVIDLSRVAAQKLDFMRSGLTKVRLDVIEPPKK